ncbi:MAG: UDP-N-acetylmuramoyl-L-alanine--D-glutamate ligase [Alloprevotella sp.]|nr:UDP-N-acetylmuramoyl-L-alanine--D-glutamate ligase [Alloprevotella sp.]
MKRLAVLGAAESGIGTAVLGQKMGYDVFVSDSGNIKDCYKAELEARHILWEEGGHTLPSIMDADEVVKSPGIPDTVPVIRQLHEKGIPVISEIEFAGRYTKARMVCITGSNGKTTTTSLIFHIMKKAGFNVGLAGNIGRSLARQVAENDKDWYVIELSSFQLDGMFRFRADIGVLLNITPDHLDRYDYKMENYAASKMRILQNQRSEDSFVYWMQDEYIPEELCRLKPASRQLAFSDTENAETAAFIGENSLVIPAFEGFEIPFDDIMLQGRHNMRNCMAAALASRAAGVVPSDIKAGMKDFPGIEHRLEYAGEANGVRYINDSKATNIDACYCALESMTTPVVLILGGLDKGNDYTTIAPLVHKKCRALVFLGMDNTKLQNFFADFGLPTCEVRSMKDCVRACADFAQVGDTVLLSPCCASFDLFHNMEDRGEQFKQQVKALQAEA